MAYEPRGLTFDQFEEGQVVETMSRTITEADVVNFAGISGDFNPLHTDDSVARASGMKGVIAQGILIMGFMGQAIAGWIHLRDLKRFKVRFKGVTYPGDAITVRAVVREKKRLREGEVVLCDITAEDQNGETKVSGEFEVMKTSG